MSFDVKVLNVCKVLLIYFFSFASQAFGLSEFVSEAKSRDIYPYVFFEEFNGFSLTFRSLIHFELIFVYHVSEVGV